MAADTLSRFAQKSQTKEEMLKDENTQIFHSLQTLSTKVSIAGRSF